MHFSFKHWLLFFFTFIITILFLYTNYTKAHSNHLQVHYLDIGQGDATLIITPENQKILIDTGPAGKLGQKFKKYLAFFDKKIDLLILTHPDSDHIGGIFEVLKNYHVQKIVLPHNIQNKVEFRSLLSYLKNTKTKILLANQNTDLIFGKNLLIDFVYPFKNSSIQKQNSFSNSSLVFKIIYGKNTFLFSGDAINKQEKEVVLSQLDLKADLYQAGHHGSKTSSSLVFLQAIQPNITIISAEKDNPFGHPHQEILNSLKLLNSKIYQTSRIGDISFYSDGEKYWLK